MLSSYAHAVLASRIFVLDLVVPAAHPLGTTEVFMDAWGPIQYKNFRLWLEEPLDFWLEIFSTKKFFKKWVVERHVSDRIRMESRSVFQAKTQAIFFLQTSPLTVTLSGHGKSVTVTRLSL